MKKVIIPILSVFLCATLILCSFSGCKKNNDALVVGGKYTLSLGEFNYYYFLSWEDLYKQAKQYDAAYGEGSAKEELYFDYNLAPDKQQITMQNAAQYGVDYFSFGTEFPLWADILKCIAIQTAFLNKEAVEKAEELNIAVTDEELALIDDEINLLSGEAKIYKMELGEYIQEKYGEGVTEEIIRSVMTESFVGKRYTAAVEKNVADSITDEKVQDTYNTDAKYYNIASYHIGCFRDKDKADAFIQELSDESQFTALFNEHIKNDSSYDAKKDNKYTTFIEDGLFPSAYAYHEDVGNWIFNEQRKVGDKAVITAQHDSEGTNIAYYAIYMVKPMTRNEAPLHNIRYIQLAFDKAKTSSIEISNFKKEVDKIYNQYLENPTEENFSELASKYSNDLSNAQNGGYFDNACNDGRLQQSIADWVTDAVRVKGDTSIFLTDNGYYILYYIEQDGIYWEESVRANILYSEMTKFRSNFSQENTSTVNLADPLLDQAVYSQCAIIGKMLETVY